MNICIDGTVIENRADTGIGVYTYEIIKGMYKESLNNKHHYFILASNLENFTEFNENENFSLLKLDRYDIEVIKEVLISKKIDVYHMPRNAIPYLDEKVCKYVITIHDLIPIMMPEVIRPGAMKDFLLNVTKGIYDADKIITVSEYSKKDIVDFFKISQDKVKVTYLAAEDNYTLNSDRSGSQLIDKVKEKYNINYPYVLYFGGFNKRKNVHTLIKCFSNLIKQNRINKDIRLVLGGKVMPSCQYLLDLIKELDIEENVRFIGMVEKEDMASIYKNALMFVYPSLYEGFGLPPIEALSVGTFVLTSNVTSIPEILKDVAVYFDPRDEKDIEDKLEKYLCDFKDGLKNIEEEKNRRESDRNSLLKSLSFQNTWASTLKVYEELIM